MKCPHCDYISTQILDSRSQKEATQRYRRYKCLSCKKRFSSYEHYSFELKKDASKIDELRDLFLWLWRHIYSVSMNDSTVADLRWNIENYSSQNIKAKLRKYIYTIKII